MKKLISIAMLSLSFTNILVAQEADVGLPAQTDDRYCTTCHGVEGRGNYGVRAPRLAGMESWYLTRQLENFRSGMRGSHDDDIEGRAMRPMAAKLTDASIADIVDWVGNWDYVPAEITIEGNISRGRTAFQACAACHGANAEGNEAIGAPALAGQNDWYLVTQLNNFRAGFRGSFPGDSYGAQMVTMSRSLRDDQAVLDVVSYINSLGR